MLCGAGCWCLESCPVSKFFVVVSPFVSLLVPSYLVVVVVVVVVVLPCHSLTCRSLVDVLLFCVSLIPFWSYVFL